ncbi:hypothetical protein WIV_gp175 [Wiseana iridescent virus]|uniref:Uncharacterized protein n=1 Tax=Wiseana iridescent virus TaxID=68347 RepID=G0T5K1_IRV9|nr:hypothetical protein WIV_gp175 [Wiseana iridescent virus]ADO00519.1 hypothetical protein [Wiseana iridescent virus]
MENTNIVDIFTFIQRKNVGIDVDSEWFQELWYPLSKKRHILCAMPLFNEKLDKKRGSLEATPGQVNSKPQILLRSNLIG